MSDAVTITVGRRDPAVADPAELRDRLVDALELRLCQRGRAATFAAMIADVLSLLESGDEEHGVPPVLLVANPAPEHVRSCRKRGIPCPPPAHIEEGMVLSDGLATAWERRIRRLIKPCAPLTDGRRRVVEAKFHETHSTTARATKGGYWELLLECGHHVKRRVGSATKSRVPKWAPCCHCGGRKQEDP